MSNNLDYNIEVSERKRKFFSAILFFRRFFSVIVESSILLLANSKQIKYYCLIAVLFIIFCT